MPSLVVEETTVYTLEELQDANYSAYRKALDNVISWCSEDYYWIENLSDGLIDWLESESLIFVDYRMRQNHLGKPIKDYYLTWDYYRREVNFSGMLYLDSYMEKETEKGKLLKNKYRSLYHALKNLGVENQISFNANGRDDAKFDGSIGGIEYSLELCLEEGEITKQQYEKMLEQLKIVANYVWQYIDNWHSKLVSSMVADIEYRESEEFAVEEAEALELRFLEDGSIYH